ncbi:MAG: fused MFS/spermidine synthase [Anaerolineales bacterium]
MKNYLAITTFFAGMTALAVEFGASRLLQMKFSAINLVWAVIIGLILVYFSLGYELGGRAADRWPRPQTLFDLLTASGLSLLAVTLLSQPVLLAAARASDALNLGIMGGAFLGTLLLFSLPVTLLAMVSPFILRLSVEKTETVGAQAGRLSAISTLGSVLGAFLPTLALFPLIGTYRSLLIFAALPLILALGGGLILRHWPRILLNAVLAALTIFLAINGQFRGKDTARQIFETESEYNYIEVLQQPDGTRQLRLNDGQGVHSEYRADSLFYGGPWEQFLAGPFFNAAPHSPRQVERIAIIGLAAGTTARQASAIFGAIPIDGYEIDPKIVQVGRDYFGMNLPNLNIFITDGRWGLEHSRQQYSLIAVDAYRPPYIPPPLTTREFFQIAAEHLAPDGVLAINIGRTPGDRRLINDLAATVASVLPSVYVMDIPATFNSILYATKQPTRAENLSQNLALLQVDPATHPLLLQVTQIARDNLQASPSGGQIYTDDLAPIEWVTNDMILRFLLGDELKTLQ